MMIGMYADMQVCSYVCLCRYVTCWSCFKYKLPRYLDVIEGLQNPHNRLAKTFRPKPINLKA